MMATDQDFPNETTSMNDPKRRFFSGDNLHQAVIQAANYFNLDPSYVAYQPIEKRQGLLKGRRKVVIEVDPDNPRRETPVSLPMTSGGRVLPPAPPSSYRREPAASAAPISPPISANIERPSPPPPVAPPPRSAAEPRPERGDDRGNRIGGNDRNDRGGRNDRGPRGGRGGEGGGRRESRERPRRRREEARITRPARESEPPQPTFDAQGGLVALPETPRRVSERYPAANGPVAEAAVKAAELLVRIAGLDLVPQVFQGEERLELDLAGADADWCFADDGELVNAIEHLLPRMIRSLSGEAVPVRVDCDNFQEIREERLRSLAQRVAEEVRRRGRPSVLEPMNPADRRIIHVTLADDPGVVTESE
ncbi:MAG TPA: R3H domain-containing nucleic acid-binding protein, partial [Thermoanaerobaculia bacterium]|nr:R3H domain-containing nucleic acid-binding protein [Thermoanaerobaculia bacterium]